MRIVFDTNVLISGFLSTTGPAQSVLNASLKKHTVVLSSYILKEFESKLLGKLEIPKPQVQRALNFLKEKAFILETVKTKDLLFSDSKDIPILHLVDGIKPEYFVTGDKKLLDLKKRGQTLILSPRELMEVLFPSR